MKQRYQTDASQRALTELTQALHALLRLIQALRVEHREETVVLAGLKMETAHLQKRLDSLARLVQEGDGREPLTIRLALAEASLAALQERSRKAEQQRRSREQQKIAGHWQVVVALVTGLFGLIAALLALLK